MRMMLLLRLRLSLALLVLTALAFPATAKPIMLRTISAVRPAELIESFNTEGTAPKLLVVLSPT